VSDRAALLVVGATSCAVVLAVGLLLLGQPAIRPSASPIGTERLPAINAFLNGTSAVLLVGGFLFIRRKQVAAHRACMLGAFTVSVLFLISYLAHHYEAGSVPFRGQGWIRPTYFALLTSHVVLAAAVVPLALLTIYRGWTARLDRHVRIARWTLPIWLYVSVTGVVVYLMLYRLAPAR
jgi:uncharacterized membrane protein YozB (DUF420 family)